MTEIQHIEWKETWRHHRLTLEFRYAWEYLDATAAADPVIGSVTGRVAGQAGQLESRLNSRLESARRRP